MDVVKAPSMVAMPPVARSVIALTEMLGAWIVTYVCAERVVAADAVMESLACKRRCPPKLLYVVVVI